MEETTPAARPYRAGVEPARALALATFLSASLAALYYWGLAGLHPAAGNHLWVWPLVAVGAWAANRQAVRIRDRESSVSLALTGVPLLVAVVFLAPAPALAAVFCGQLAAELQMRRTVVKAVVNCLILSFSMGVCVVVYDASLAQATPVSLRGWLASVAALGAFTLLDYAGVLGAGAFLYRRWRLPAVRPLAVEGCLDVGLCTLAGLIAVAMGWLSIWDLVLVWGMFAPALIGWRLAEHATQRRGRLEKLYAFTQALAAAQGGERDVMEVVLDQARTLLAASHAELVAPLQAPLEGLAVRCSLSGDNAVKVQEAVPAGDLARAVADLGALLLGRDKEEGKLAAAALGLTEAVVAPLQPGDPGSGYLLVGDRPFAHEGFGTDDLQLLPALAADAAVALKRGGLLDKLRQEAAETQHQAHHDALTGLPNRALFSERLREALENRPGRVAVALLDLDNFKQVNDTLGHQAGDVVLAEVARRLGPMAGRETLVSRLGGDEFVILFEVVEDEDACLARVRHTLGLLKAPMLVGTIELVVTASAGVAVSGTGKVDRTSLLRHADMAMYRAKADGGGVRLYEPSADHATLRRLTMATELRRAIEARTLDLHYQPVVELSTGRVIGCEALSRWSHERFGPISPDEFIPVAETAGLIEPLTWWAIDTALAQLKEWREVVPDLSVAVNLSAASLVRRGLADSVADALRRAGLEPRALRLELTESSMMAEQGTATLHELSELGVALSVDDFGTGYSSLTRLRHLPFDEVKIDKSFVTHMARAGVDEAVVRSVIQLAKGLDKMATAEGVEDKATMQRLAALGCHAVQGFYIARPLPAPQCETFLLAVSHWPDNVEALSAHPGPPAGPSN